MDPIPSSSAPTVPPPRRCETLRRIATHAGGSWTPRTDSDATPDTSAGVGSPAYALPVHATPETLAYLRPLARATFAERGMAWLPAGRVFGAGAVLSADGEVLARDVSADFGKPFETHWLLGLETMRPPTALDGATAVVAVNRGGGYCHWLLEELPRLLTLPRGAGAVKNIIAHETGGFVREARALRGGGETWVPARRASHFACAPLLVPGLVAEAGAPTPEATRLVRKFAEPLGRGADAAKTSGAERVYISRAKAGRRRVANEDELWRELETRGFTRVYLEDLSWAEQIAVARAARVMVAPHGAGLANLVFCAPATRVVELVNRAYFNPCFWRLAALGGLDYRPLVAAGEGGIGEDRARNREDIRVDVTRVRAALAD